MATESSRQAEIVYVEKCKGINGLDKIVLRERRGYSAEVYLFGGQVTSWTTARGEELIFVSKKAEFKPPKPIRGGIQMCFPEFTFQNREKYGFARNRLWTVDPSPQLPSDSTHKASIDLILQYSEEDRWDFPHKYEFRLRVTLGPDGNLTLISRIRNINLNGKPFTFSFAYNAHFCVSDVGEVRIEGFETYDYLDNLKNRERITEQGNALTFEEEIDRIYLDIPHKIAIIDHERKRTYVLRKDGLTDAGVWNPWDNKAKALPDLGNDEYLKMVCVQPARIVGENGKRGVTIKPGEEWRGKLQISLAHSSYHSGQLDPLKALTSSGAGSTLVSKASSSTASRAGGASTSSSSPSKVGTSGACSSAASEVGGAISSSSSPSKAGKSGAISSSSSPSKGGTSGAKSSAASMAGGVISSSSSPSKTGTSRAISSSSSPSKGGTSGAKSSAASMDGGVISCSSSPSKAGTSREISGSSSPSKGGTSVAISSSSSPSKDGTTGAKSTPASKAGGASSSSSPSKDSATETS